MAVSVEQIKQLRELTGAGMMDCRKALEENGGDVERAAAWLRERGIAKAASRAGRATQQGVVEAYVHRTGDYPPQVGALVEVDCESDFVAKGEDFRKLARELAMHISAMAPRWVSREDVPVDVVEEKRSQGELEAFLAETCLLEQPYIRDPGTPVKDLIAQHISKLQENIVVRRFARFNIREG